MSSWLRSEGHDKLLLTHQWARTDQERDVRGGNGERGAGEPQGEAGVMRFPAEL